MKQKKAAVELTMGTMVTVVLAISALILGIVLVQKIFTGATDSVDTVNEKVMGEINNLFADENSNVLVKLGGDKKAKIRVGTEEFGVAIGAMTPDGTSTNRERMTYKISFDEKAKENCITKIGKSATESLLVQPIGTWLPFDMAQGATAGARVSFKIPKGTAICSQKIYIDVRDGTEEIGSTYFQVELLKKIL